MQSPRKNEAAIKSGEVGDERILLVEDDPLLNVAFQKALSAAGYIVVAANNAEEALVEFGRDSKGFDLLLTDVVLPKMNGSDLYMELKKRAPELKAIFVSGYTENSIVHHAVLDTESVLVQKPVSIKNLLKTLRKVFDGEMTKGIVP
jgi:DNA-binding NtrC family response regulator